MDNNPESAQDGRGVLAPDEYSESVEMYLKTIYQIVEEKKVARAKNIAAQLNVNNSSVTCALHSLADRGLINYAPYEVITLTEQGEKIAEEIMRRYKVIKGFFVRVLQIDEEEADACACRMEHVVYPSVLQRLADFVQFVDNCPLGGAQLLEEFHKHCSTCSVGDGESASASCPVDPSI